LYAFENCRHGGAYEGAHTDRAGEHEAEGLFKLCRAGTGGGSAAEEGSHEAARVAGRMPGASTHVAAVVDDSVGARAVGVEEDALHSVGCKQTVGRGNEKLGRDPAVTGRLSVRVADGGDSVARVVHGSRRQWRRALAAGMPEARALHCDPFAVRGH
jgi:hypothetical protein